MNKRQGVGGGNGLESSCSSVQSDHVTWILASDWLSETSVG